MHVLDHEHGRRPAGQLVGERAEQFVRCPRVGRDLRELDTGRVGDVEERPERPRREQSLARPPQHPARPVGGAEGSQQGGLAHARLAAEQHQSPVPSGGVGQRGLEPLEQLVALEQLEPVDSSLPGPHVVR